MRSLQIGLIGALLFNRPKYLLGYLLSERNVSFPSLEFWPWAHPFHCFPGDYKQPTTCPDLSMAHFGYSGAPFNDHHAGLLYHPDFK